MTNQKERIGEKKQVKKKEKRQNSEENRKLTMEEELRKEKYQKMREKLLAEGYQERDMTIGIVYANAMALAIGLPLILLFVVLFMIFGSANSGDVLRVNLVLLFILFMVGIVIHELIHGTVWAIFAKGHFKAIRFGYIMEYLTPYCCCMEMLPKLPYIIGALAPTVLLGILPCLIAIGNGSWMLFLLGCAMIIGGGGDMTMVLKLLCYRSECREVLYIDHPYKCGTMIFER